MVYRRIIHWPNRSLNSVSRDCILDKDNQVCADLIDTFRISGGYGLSAPQIGFNIRIIVINESILCGRDNLSKELLMINPKILEKNGTKIFPEACFSLPNLSFDIERSAKINVEWTDESGERKSKWFEDYSSACIQHEIDHLDGILTIDKISQLRKSLILKKFQKIKSKKAKKSSLSSEEISKQKSLKTRKKNRNNRKLRKKR